LIHAKINLSYQGKKRKQREVALHQEPGQILDGIITQLIDLWVKEKQRVMEQEKRTEKYI